MSFNPWEGTDYADGLREGTKLLIVGDSHYLDPDEGMPDQNLTRRSVEAGGTTGTWTFFEHIRLTACGLRNPPQPSEFWKKVAFVNLVQVALPSSRTVPTPEQFSNGWAALRESVEGLKPDIMFMYSARGWNAVTSISQRIEDGADRYRDIDGLKGLGLYPRMHSRPLVAALLNHPRFPGCSRDVWRVWTELAWMKASALRA